VFKMRDVGRHKSVDVLQAYVRDADGWPMTRNNVRIIAKWLREAGWSEVTALRQQLAAGKARVQEMGRHNAIEAEHFRAICRRIEDWVSIMTCGAQPCEHVAGQCVRPGTAAQVHRWLREQPVSGPLRRAESNP
jgi:hypothetical protein